MVKKRRIVECTFTGPIAFLEAGACKMLGFDGSTGLEAVPTGSGTTSYGTDLSKLK